MAAGLCGGMLRKEARGLEFGVDKKAEKRVEGRAEWRRLPAELSFCIVGTLSKILIQSVQGGVYHFSWVRSGSRQSYAPIWKRR